MTEVSPLYAATRHALLDALEALVDQREALVLVGAHAIFLHTGETDEAIATETKDADLALDPGALVEDPLLEAAAAASRPHDKMSARRVYGIEGALIDHAPMTVGALTSDDQRAYIVEVAGPAALLVAKLHKVADRETQPLRRRPRDAHDVYRLLRDVEPDAFSAGFERLMAAEVSTAVSREAIVHLDSLFGRSGQPGAQQAAEAVAPLVAEPQDVAVRCAALAREVLRLVR